MVDDTKVCAKCGFSFSGKYCPECRRISRKAYREANKEKLRLQKSAHYYKNRDRIAKKNAEYYKNNYEKIRETNKLYKVKNKEAYKERDKLYYLKNKEKIKLRSKNWKAQNPERVRELNKSWEMANKSKVSESHRKYSQANSDKLKAYQLSRRKLKPWLSAYYSAKYEQSTIERTPVWSDAEEIFKIYKDCPVGFEVDHIIPLRGKLVSGLHVPSNLQYLPTSVNRRKLNKFWPDLFNPYYAPKANLVGTWVDIVTGFEYNG